MLHLIQYAMAEIPLMSTKCSKTTKHNIYRLLLFMYINNNMPNFP